MNRQEKNVEFLVPSGRSAKEYSIPVFKKSWSREEILSLFPESSITLLDVGAGDFPFRARAQDKCITLDFDQSANPDILCDLTQELDIEAETIDFVYMSHVVEHFYPKDRDLLIERIFRCMKKGALLFIRVPHWSSLQATGWEHHTFYGTNGVTSLTHGRNPNLPRMELISAGVWMSDLSGFSRPRSIFQVAMERFLNSSFRMTDSYFCYLVGGISEVQFLLRKP